MKEALNWNDLKRIGKYGKHKAWYPDESVEDYFVRNIRAPSRAYPYSYARAAQTSKFVNWLFANRPEVAALFKFNEEEFG
jgi:hypothetical protein